MQELRGSQNAGLEPGDAAPWGWVGSQTAGSEFAEWLRGRVSNIFGRGFFPFIFY